MGPPRRTGITRCSGSRDGKRVLGFCLIFTAFLSRRMTCAAKFPMVSAAAAPIRHEFAQKKGGGLL